MVVGPRPRTAILVDAAKPAPVPEVLRREGVQTISLAILTHDDLDHVRGMAPVLRTFVEDDGGHIECVAIDQARFEAKDCYKRTVQCVLELRKRNGTRICQPNTDSITLNDVLGSGRVGRLLYPEPADVKSSQVGGRPNDGSVVLMLEWGGHSALLGGDVGRRGWQALIWDRHEDLRADVFRYPHHGSAFDPPDPKAKRPVLSETQLLDAVAPSVVVISVGTLNAYDHPDPLVVQAIRKRGRGRTGVRLLCTEATHQCTEVSGSRPPKSRRHAIRCAGSVTIELGGKSIKIVPTHSQHKSVFSGFAGPMRCR